MSDQNDRLDNEFKSRPFYDRLYAKDKATFGGAGFRPEQFVEFLAGELKEGSVFEIGAGQGRNALFLAKQGLTVEATDISSVGIEQMQEAAQAEGLPLVARLADAQEPLSKDYDALVGTYVFHHIEHAGVLAILKDFQLHTTRGGYNVIAAFTTDGDFYKQSPSTPYWYPEPGELRDLYDGWEILQYEESKKKALASAKDGSPHFNTVARILARKR